MAPISMKSPSLLAVVSLVSSMVSANSMTYHDYLSLADNVNNPPTCGIPYTSLDVNRITAWCGIGVEKCGTCLEVCGSRGCENVLVVDVCTNSAGHLDMSPTVVRNIEGSLDAGNWVVQVTEVDQSMCSGIWNGEKCKVGTVELPPSGKFNNFQPAVTPVHVQPTTSTSSAAVTSQASLYIQLVDHASSSSASSTPEPAPYTVPASSETPVETVAEEYVEPTPVPTTPSTSTPPSAPETTTPVAEYPAEAPSEAHPSSDCTTTTKSTITLEITSTVPPPLPASTTPSTSCNTHTVTSKITTTVIKSYTPSTYPTTPVTPGTMSSEPTTPVSPVTTSPKPSTASHTASQFWNQTLTSVKVSSYPTTSSPPPQFTGAAGKVEIATWGLGLSLGVIGLVLGL
ncbi:hypothetical protein M501DRAFT_532808 [Patellaria atrata CBS 101060]|uniref:Expansin-like EG45 domain-containing protein n=1 Tax=Patellaria atrata CBS 101060 TaxID=1346257 RepID=A0A9P4SGN1_9PEZI|nr:hypothetical protein M501DRAFT_532808 [Patellaria atrata CBS 101060]